MRGRTSIRSLLSSIRAPGPKGSRHIMPKASCLQYAMPPVRTFPTISFRCRRESTHQQPGVRDEAHCHGVICRMRTDCGRHLLCLCRDFQRRGGCTAFTYTIMETVRSRSIAARAKDIQPPPLDDATLIATGAGHYAAMCSGCHLAPGEKESEIRVGLYPKPPDLTKHVHASPAEEFWVIKRGIKMSGMSAWGVTHDDPSIWGLVAFLQKLPELGPDQYQEIVSKKAEVQHKHGDHVHQGAAKAVLPRNTP